VNPPQRVFRYHCVQCGAKGELPLVEGDTPCPHCGEHLWTVRGEATPEVRPGSQSRFGPDCRIPILNGRPPLKWKGLWLARLCVVLFRPIVVLLLIPRQRIMEARVNAKLDEMLHYRGREELERLLGEPVYAVSGMASGAVLDDATQDRPDLIECYESDGCCIDLWFKDDRMVDVSGFVKPTVWDFLLADRSEQAPRG
jgi:hypothetical protein